MKYCTVISCMSKGPTIESNNHMCSERQLIRRLYRECLRKGYKAHQFSEWMHRKYGHLIVYRKTVYGDGISLPCVLCRKTIYVGSHTTENGGCTVRKPKTYHRQYQQLNKKES